MRAATEDRALSERGFIIAGPDAERVDVSICWRYLGQPCVKGTRIDLRCYRCNHRVAADPNTQKFTAKGAKAICHECLEAVGGIEKLAEEV